MIALLVSCQSPKQWSFVIPAQAGIHTGALDSRLRGNDKPKINLRQSTRSHSFQFSWIVPKYLSLREYSGDRKLND
jgi:hypothetical protein